MTTAALPKVTVVRDRTALAVARQSLVGPVVVVPTMGALHEGHATLLRAARERAGAEGSVVATIFVNPLQFGPTEDFDRYPRMWEADLALCAAEGVDLVFAPLPNEIYPQGTPSVTVDPGELGRRWEGASRPGFFTGVLTVVAKLLLLTHPEAAVFGEKDYQQLVLVRRMVRDLDLGVEILGVPTVREASGLALSSRNRYLSAEGTATAQRLSAALAAGQAAGSRGSEAVLAHAQVVLGASPGLRLDYLDLTASDLGPAPTRGEARLIVAAWVGGVRLIDNVPVELGRG
jgi:pantoate--beta-alanine ligase